MAGMEVQVPVAPSYPPRKAPRVAGDAASPSLPTTNALAHLGNLPGVVFLPEQQMLTLGTTAVFSGEPESGLTCNASGSRKRAFLDGGVAHATLQQQQKTRLAHDPRDVAPLVKAAPAAHVGTPSSLQVSYDEVRWKDSAMASTSGRPPAEAPLPAETVPAISPLMEELVSQLCHQRLEVDALIRLQNERVRSEMEQARKRHHRALLSAMEQGVLRRLREKDAELESASRRNADLEEKIRQLATENQIWFNVARNNEAIVSSLRATLDHVLLHNATAGGPAMVSAQSQQQQEGYGESDCAAPVFPADDARSCCYEGAFTAAAAEAEHDTAVTREARLRSSCKACQKREAAVLLLPCRHVCLCRQCDPGVDACPVCNAAKSASLQVFLC